MALTRDEFKALVQAGPPNQWSGAVAAWLGERARTLTAAWRRATKGERARVTQAFTAHMEVPVESYEMDSGERKAAKAAQGARKAAQSADVAREKMIADTAQSLERNLNGEERDLLAQELNEALEAMGLPALEGGADPKLAKAFLLVLSAAKAAGVKTVPPEFAEPGQNTMWLGTVRAMIQDPKFQEFIEKSASAEKAEEPATEEAPPAPDRNARMNLFASRVNKAR